MPSYTTSLRLVQPATGEYSGTWGTEVNTGITALVDASIAGTTSITMTAANYTLTTANGASDESRAMFLVLGGTPGAAREVIVPAVSKLYFVTNSTTGGFAQTVKTASGSGISVPNGARMTPRCDGTDVVVAQNYFASMTLGAALPTASGGTGLTSFTANGVVYASSTSALATGSGLTYNGTNLVVSSGSFTSGGSTFAGALNAIGGGSGATIAITPNTISGANGVVYNTSFVSGGAGPHIFQVSGSEYMRLDSSGNLGLGVTPGAWAAAAKAIEFTFPTYGQDAAGSAFMSFNARNSTGSTWVYKSTDEAAKFTATTSGGFTWETAPSGTAGNAISFTQAMTLTSGGDLLVGTTTNPQSARLYVLGSGYNATAIRVATNTNVATSYLNDSGTEVGYVQVNASSTTYSTSSDRRLKENIQPADDAGSVIDAIEVVKHDWKVGGHTRYGMIAQDLHTVAPEAVSAGDNGDEIERTWGVDYSKLVPMLIKEIQTLRARVAALEQA